MGEPTPRVWNADGSARWRNFLPRLCEALFEDFGYTFVVARCESRNGACSRWVAKHL